jgi:hypothetical protein
MRFVTPLPSAGELIPPCTRLAVREVSFVPCDYRAFTPNPIRNLISKSAAFLFALLFIGGIMLLGEVHAKPNS